MPKNSKSPKDKTKTKPVAAPEPRKLKQPTYRSFKLQKKLPKPEMVKLSSSFKILRQVFGVLGKNWKLFLGIALVYAVLNLLLVQGFFGTDVAGTKDSVNSMASGQLGKLSGGLSVLGTITDSAGTDASTSAYRFVLLIIASLATIWGLRQVMAGEKIRVRDTFYEGMYPLVPFVLVFLVASLQLAPMAF